MSLLNEISKGAHSTAFGNTQDITSNVDATYGEVTEDGIRTIFSKLDITPNDLWLDLGSGTGRVVFQVFLEKNIPSCGIEFIDKRHDIAEESLLKLKQKVENPLVRFVHGDFFKVDWSEATIIFMCNTCFSDQMMDKIVNRLQTCNKLRYVIMLKQLDNKPVCLDVLESFMVPVTWTDETNVTIYKACPDKYSIKRNTKRTSRHRRIRKSHTK